MEDAVSVKSLPWIDVEDLKYESDDRGDYYDDVMKKSFLRRKDLKESSLSSVWSCFKSKRKQDQDIVYELLAVQETVKSLIKIHGVMKGVVVSIASVDSQEKSVLGASGFKDYERFRGPYIRLSRHIYEECEGENVLDVYCGIALHEASHINHTREFFKRLYNCKISGKRRIWENLLEDERIENLVEQESPGFSSYIEATKIALCKNKECAVEWKSLSDLDKICLIIFLFIRMPYELTDEMKVWKDLKGFNVYEELRRILCEIPEDEDAVQFYADKLEKFFDKEQKYYDDLIKKDSSDITKELFGENYSKEELMSVHRIIQKHKKEKSADSIENGFFEEINEALSHVDDMGVGVDLIKSVEKECRRYDKSIEDFKRKKKSLESMRMGKRFGLLEIKKLLERYNNVEKLSVEESKELKKASEEKLTFAEEWKEGYSSSLKRRTIIIHPKCTSVLEEKYKKGVFSVKNHINKMRSIFRYRAGVKTYEETELLEGRLHKRMIGRAKATERIFYRSYVRVVEGLSLCLLLDESASMGECDNTFIAKTRAVVCQKIAILIAEALKDLLNVELEIYSYGSCGENDKDCLIKYLYGKENVRVESLAGYVGSYQNYDHIAIKTAGDLFLKNTTNKKRIMIVISDGDPAGYDYGGEYARQLTKASVDALERKGILVINIAINSYKSEEMFKHTLKFLDLGDLINKMRKLIVQIIKQTC